jgi:plasmid stabilization system protein ParE
MSYRVVITGRALDDLRDIRDYIAKRSPANAERFLNRLLDGFDPLETTPEGFGTAPEDELVPYTLRQIIVKPSRILYRLSGRRVEILHIRHGARQAASPDELS